MKLRINAKNWRIVEDEMGNEIFMFTGLHIDELRRIIMRFNGGYEVI